MRALTVRHNIPLEADMLALPYIFEAIDPIRDRVRPGAPLSTVFMQEI